MEANPIETHMRTALRMRVLRDVELDEARRWFAVFGRATDYHAREFLRHTIAPHVERARKFNRQMVKAQRGIRAQLQLRMRAAWRSSDGDEMVGGTSPQIQREEKTADVRSIERAPAVVDGLVACILGGAGRARAGEDGRGAVVDRGGDRAADDRGSAQGGDGRGRARRRQASRLIAFLLALGAGGSSSGCTAIGARPWSELSTGERVVNVAMIVGVAAYVAHASGGHSTYVGTGNAKPEPCAVGDPCANPSPGVPCVTAPSDPFPLPPGCARN